MLWKANSLKAFKLWLGYALKCLLEGCSHFHLLELLCSRAAIQFILSTSLRKFGLALLMILLVCCNIRYLWPFFLPTSNHPKKKKYGKHARTQLLHLHLPIVNQNHSKQATTTVIKSDNGLVRDWKCTFKDIVIYLIHWNQSNNSKSDEISYIKL